MPQMYMNHDEDPRELILTTVGDLSEVDVMYSNVLIGIYTRPAKTKGGILLTDETRKEDLYQGKVGLVLKLGPMAFQDTDEVSFQGQKVNVGDWVVIRPSDGWAVSIRKQDCRVVSDAGIRMKISSPDVVW